MTVTLSDEVTATLTPPEGFVVTISPTPAVSVAPTPAPSMGLVVPVAGLRGSSAYELARLAGFTGTEEEWLASLTGHRGPSAYEVAVASGFTGTESEWLESLRGPSGRDANFYGEYGFATPSTVWLIEHGQNSYGLNVEAFDNNGDEVEGDVDYLDANTVQITWFYPMTGTARVFN